MKKSEKLAWLCLVETATISTALPTRATLGLRTGCQLSSSLSSWSSLSFLFSVSMSSLGLPPGLAGPIEPSSAYQSKRSGISGTSESLAKYGWMVCASYKERAEHYRSKEQLLSKKYIRNSRVNERCPIDVYLESSFCHDATFPYKHALLWPALSRCFRSFLRWISLGLSSQEVPQPSSHCDGLQRIPKCKHLF